MSFVCSDWDRQTKGRLRMTMRGRVCPASTDCQPVVGRQAASLGGGAETLTTLRKIGRDGGIRTHDPLTPSQVRYQAALHPVFEDP